MHYIVNITVSSWALSLTYDYSGMHRDSRYISTASYSGMYWDSRYISTAGLSGLNYRLTHTVIKKGLEYYHLNPEQLGAQDLNGHSNKDLKERMPAATGWSEFQTEGKRRQPWTDSRSWTAVPKRFLACHRQLNWSRRGRTLGAWVSSFSFSCILFRIPARAVFVSSSQSRRQIRPHQNRHLENNLYFVLVFTLDLKLLCLKISRWMTIYR